MMNVKKLQLESENAQSKLNSSAKEIGQLMAKGQKAEADVKKQEVASLKASQQPIADRLALVEKQLQDSIVRLPNMPSAKVPQVKHPKRM
ncbi:hypothetical protein [Paraflavitalea speifideaquila]|uniref:hypothetical protein n=1 Tax=Paraflavitalea speifideaquila TaxID=3076558 RepID=UPI0028EF2700|nr:hypothetical protein [Paraflavitalea speifideiaquila]